MAYDFVEGDTGSTLQATCLNQDGTAIGLTGSTVTLYWVTTSDSTVKSGKMTISDAANGVVTYQFGEGELTSGTLTAEIEIEDSSNKVMTCMTSLSYQVRARTNRKFT